jgi:hypothetical protein
MMKKFSTVVEKPVENLVESLSENELFTQIQRKNTC